MSCIAYTHTSSSYTTKTPVTDALLQSDKHRRKVLYIVVSLQLIMLPLSWNNPVCSPNSELISRSEARDKLQIVVQSLNTVSLCWCGNGRVCSPLSVSWRYKHIVYRILPRCHVHESPVAVTANSCEIFLGARAAPCATFLVRQHVFPRLLQGLGWLLVEWMFAAKHVVHFPVLRAVYILQPRADMLRRDLTYRQHWPVCSRRGCGASVLVR